MRHKNLAKATTLHIELLLWSVGIACAGYFCVVELEARAAHRTSITMTGQSSQTQSSQSGHKAILAKTPRPSVNGNGELSSENGEVLGQLNIPELSLSVPVLSNYEANSLLRGVGHIQGTAMPGGLGTMGLAGHRDSYFRPLRKVTIGMGVDVSDQDGTYHYRVDSTEIVTPEKVQVLSIQNRPELTLITCYPFNFIGAAPERFIVHAHLLSIVPDTLK